MSARWMCSVLLMLAAALLVCSMAEELDLETEAENDHQSLTPLDAADEVAHKDLGETGASRRSPRRKSMEKATTKTFNGVAGSKDKRAMEEKARRERKQKNRTRE